MSIARGTTPTFTLSFPPDAGIDLTQASHVYVTFRSRSNILTKSDSDLTVSATEISVHLSQSETLGLRPGPVEIQANWTKNDGSRAASEIVKVTISDNLLDESVS